MLTLHSLPLGAPSWPSVYSERGERDRSVGVRECVLWILPVHDAQDLPKRVFRLLSQHPADDSASLTHGVQNVGGAGNVTHSPTPDQRHSLLLAAGR